MNLDAFQALLDRRAAVQLELRRAGATTPGIVRKLEDELTHLQQRIDAALREAAQEDSK